MITKTALITNITQIMLLREIVIQLARVHTIIKEHTIVETDECFFHPKAVEIIPTAEDKILIKKLERKTVKTKYFVFICGIILKIWAEIYIIPITSILLINAEIVVIPLTIKHFVLSIVFLLTG